MLLFIWSRWVVFPAISCVHCMALMWVLAQSTQLLCVWQVCGVFALFMTGAPKCISWGLYCYPRFKAAALAAYFTTAAVGAFMGLTAKNKVGRALPMLALLLLRLSVLLARIILRAGSQTASWHFLCTEVRLRQLYVMLSACRLCETLCNCTDYNSESEATLACSDTSPSCLVCRFSCVWGLLSM